jgi:DNA mismatch endonuclease, patch repair protein
MDCFSPSLRSKVMAKVRGRDTQPEMRVRKAAHALGLRFRLHRKELPGSPDIVFASRKTVVFVHGCFWHSHSGCKRASMPQTKQEFWSTKLSRNIKRDQTAISTLENAGWHVEVIWECETKNASALASRLAGIVCRLKCGAGRTMKRI